MTNNIDCEEQDLRPTLGSQWVSPIPRVNPPKLFPLSAGTLHPGRQFPNG